MSIEKCGINRTVPLFEETKENFATPCKRRKRFPLEERKVTQPLSLVQIIKKSLIALHKPALSPVLSQQELDKIDFSKTTPQVVGEKEVKIIRFGSDRHYSINKGFVAECMLGLHQTGNPQLNAALESAYYECRNKLLAEALSSPDHRDTSAFLLVGDELFLINCIVSSGTILRSPLPIFTINYQKIEPQNLSIEDILPNKELLKTLIDAAAKQGKASAFIGENREYALSCYKNSSGSFSLSLAKVIVSATTLAKNEDRILNVLSEAVATGSATQVFSSEQMPYFAYGVKNPDGSFHLSEQNISLFFPPNMDEETSNLLQQIVSQLNAQRKKKGWNNESAMAELIVKASKQGIASIRCSYKDTLYHIKVTNTGNNSFDIDFASPELTQEERTVLGLETIDKTLLDRIIQTLYHEAIVFPESPKVTRNFPLSDKSSVQLSIKNGLVTIGTTTWIGAGGYKTVEKIVRAAVHYKTYVKYSAKTLLKLPGLATEATMLQYLTHPRILRFRKFSKKSKSMQAEFCEYGCIASCLGSPPQNPANLKCRLGTVYDAAQALAHISSLPDKLAHMDVKPGNIFLKNEEGKLVGKLGDFCPRPEGMKTISTFSYLDLDGILHVLSKKFFSSHQACDVWALGITLFECMYGQKMNPLLPLLNEVLQNYKDKKTIDIPGFTNSFLDARKKLLATLDDTQIPKPINDLIRKMLTLSRASRPPLDAALLQEFEAALR